MEILHTKMPGLYPSFDICLDVVKGAFRPRATKSEGEVHRLSVGQTENIEKTAATVVLAAALVWEHLWYRTRPFPY